MNNFGDKVSFNWSVADLPCGPYKPAQYGSVILPLTVLRRLDCVLEPTKAKVLAKAAELKGGKVANHAITMARGGLKMNGTVACGDCGTILIDETPQDATRKPCPECGSPKRHITMECSDEIKLYEQLRLRQKQKGTKGIVYDQISGDDYTHSTGKYNKKVRIIDRRNDHYYVSGR